MKIAKNILLKNHTTYRIGGKADFFIEAKTTKEIIEAVDFAKRKRLPFVILGNGSNILVNDKGFRGVVIKILNYEYEINGNEITCDAGLALAKLLDIIQSNSLTGLEFLWGIPGTVGGAVVGNAGSADQEINGFIKSIKIIEDTGNIRNAGPDEFHFSYRNSKFKRSGDTILSVTFSLKNGKGKELRNHISKLSRTRANQPKGFSAGSVFRNPEGEFAGNLIEKAGLKGKRIGDAEISDKHANFIINNGAAKANDVKDLIALIEGEVENKFGVQLKREIRYLEESGWK